MNDLTSREFKAATVDEAIAVGLKEMGLTAQQAVIEKKSSGGIFTKACVIITPKAVPEEAVQEDEAQEEVMQDAWLQQDAAPAAGNQADPDSLLGIAQKDCTAFVKELVAKIGVNCDVTSDTQNDEVNIYINGADAGLVIGYRGEVLDAIQYFALILANKGEKEFVRVQVDAGNYRRKRKDTLATLAKRLEAKTARSGRRTVLEPMNPFERRVIHTTLADSKEVTTQSEGEGKFRHVVIIPNNEEKYNYGRSDFSRNGPGRTRSFGNNKRKF